MGQPNPPGDLPLYEGLDPSWNDIVGAFPEDKRNELAPKLKERIDAYEPYKQWDNLQKSGVTPQQAETALSIYSMLENNPKQVYDELSKYLGVTPQQAQQAAEQVEEIMEDEEDPRLSKLASLEKQVQVMAELLMTQHQQEVQSKQQQEADAAIDKELSDLKKKYGEEVDEEEVIMRMVHQGMTAEQAHQAYMNKVTQIRHRRPAPTLLGSGGTVPKKGIDPAKLDNSGVKSLVAQMIQHSQNS
jgi:hypothetical protein